MGYDRKAIQAERQTDLAAGIRRRMVQVVVTILLQAMVLFLAAGQLVWGWAWAYLALGVAILAVNASLLLSRRPDLVAERGRMAADAKTWDKWLALLVSAVGPLAILAVAGLDRRFGWSAPLPLWVHLAGLALFATGNGLWSWAMLSNRFFSGLVRVQWERGHTVETQGPYRYVRHPGYVGMIVFELGTPLTLGSLWALVPAAVLVAALVVRTALEDRTLQSELAGYADYARRTRYRLVPPIW